MEKQPRVGRSPKEGAAFHIVNVFLKKNYRMGWRFICCTRIVISNTKSYGWRNLMLSFSYYGVLLSRQQDAMECSK